MGAEVKGETRELGVTGAEVIGKERATELGEVRVASPDNSSGVRGSGMGVVIQESWKMSAIIKKKKQNIHPSFMARSKQLYFLCRKNTSFYIILPSAKYSSHVHKQKL